MKQNPAGWSGLGRPDRQLTFLHRLRQQASGLPWIRAVVVIGSLASGRPDAASDVDLLVAVHDNTFTEAWSRRCDLHVTGAVLDWDHHHDPARGAGAHKWVTTDLVLVEALIATAASPVRLAQPWRLLTGDPTAPETWPTRPPISRSDQQVGAGHPHPVEVAFDRLKAELRAAIEHHP